MPCGWALKESAPNGLAMNTWSRDSQKLLSQSTILLVGPDSRIQRALAQELHALPTSTVTAIDFEDAGARRIDADRPPRVVVLPEKEIRPREFEAQLSELRIRTGSPRLVPIAFCHAPSEERRLALRDTGIDLALFGRFGRHALRFQINRALSPWATRRPRGELRAPQEWRTRTFSSGKEKAVRCYSLSSGGAYVVTPRPWVVGSDISLELPIGHDRLRIEGRILYTNVAGAADGRALPRGMAITFRPLSDHIQRVIRAGVTRSQSRLEV
jgi:hypothetical protein